MVKSLISQIFDFIGDIIGDLISYLQWSNLYTIGSIK